MRPFSALMILALAGLSGCGALSVLQGEATRDLFELRPPAARSCPKARIDELVVELPKARATLDSERIMIRPSALQTQYLPDAQWGETVPAMLQRLMVQSLGATGSFQHVGTAPLGLAGDYALISDIRDFNAEMTPEGPVIRLGVDAQMVREMDAEVVASGSFDVSLPAAGTGNSDLIPAFDSAARQLVTQMTDWALRSAGVSPARCR